MVGGSTVGPSSQRTGHVSEPYAHAVRWRRRSRPPVIGALVFAIAFLGFVSGFGLAYDGQKMLGFGIIAATVVLCALLVVWGVKVKASG